MIPVVYDFETYWSQTHSLTKLNPMVYVMHPETEIISVSIRIGDGPVRCVFGEDKIKKLFVMIDWSDKLAIAHNNAEFDAMIAAWRLGVKPKMWGCTLAMARPHYAKTTGLSLKALAAELVPELGAKGDLEATNTKGKHLKDFSLEEIVAMTNYNVRDTELCHGVFTKLLPRTSADEMKLIDMTIRALVEPQFVLDAPLLHRTLAEEQERKHTMLLDVATMSGAYEPGMTDEEAAAAVEKTLASAPKFAALLRSLDVEVPMKPSPSAPGSGKMVPALAKTDEAFLAMQEHSDPIVAAAARARLGVKSTLLETRIEKFLESAEVCNGLLPVPLRYYGADTTGRWSGWAYNPQNLPRVSGKPSDALRNSLRAPAGYKVVVADLSGIELRVNMFLWQVPYAMKLFEASPDKADLYKYFAAHDLYNVSEPEITKTQRQVGKVSHLGLGFGAGAATFQKVAKLMGGVDMSEQESNRVVQAYRAAHPEIAQGWRTSHDSLSYISAGEEFVIDPWGMCRTNSGGIVTPKGMIRYPKLRQERGDNGKNEWVYGEGRHKARIYAGKVTENCIAEGTLVLTGGGWKRIETVTTADVVHDGIEFVRHEGAVFKSTQRCVCVDGVYMTPDHEVLDETGNWKEASQLQRPYRPAIRGAVLPLSEGEPAHSASGQPQSYKVYDIVNAGPRHRFVVLGANGPFIVHNCVQHLARCVIADNALEVKRRTKRVPALMVHDELVYIVPEDEAEAHLALVQEVMRTPPAWWPQLVTWSEGDIADTYGAAK